MRDIVTGMSDFFKVPKHERVPRQQREKMPNQLYTSPESMEFIARKDKDKCEKKLASCRKELSKMLKE